MRWSWKLGRIAGIDVYIHLTFLLLLAWVGLSEWTRTQNSSLALQTVLFIALLFGCVVLHEFGHALAARRYGIRTADITLLPIGGIARLERMPEDPKQELVVALAGPFVNVVIAGLLYAVLSASGSLTALASADESLNSAGGPLLFRLMVVNVFLVVFNLLPAFPMDGGRVFRALLALKLDYARATNIAATVGQIMAAVFFLLGLTGGSPMLMLIALFVYFGAEQESAAVQMQRMFDGIPVSRAMVTDFRSVSRGDRLAQVVNLILSGSQHDFPVIDGGRFEGMLTRNDLMRVLAERGPEVPVAEVMRSDLPLVEAGIPLNRVFQLLQEHQAHALPVMQVGRLVGLLTMENIGELVMIRSALKARRRA